MNISDFVDTIKIQLEDLERVGQEGYVEGISNIIIKNLKDLEVTKRPIHCSDMKRETMYIKNKDKWEKDTEQKEKMKQVVHQISKKNCQMIPAYKARYPGCSSRSDSKKGNEYDSIVIESIGGVDDNKDKKVHNIIKKVAHDVVIDK
jgi:hypothetical protein